MMKRVGIPLLGLALTGCASMSNLVSHSDDGLPGRISCSDRVQPADRVHLELVDSQSAEGRRYAALAQLESRPLSALPHWLRYGQLKAGVGELDQAEHVFQQLVRRCGAGEAYHGLGLVMLKMENRGAGLGNLQQARQLLPASANIRNDLGYALMLEGDYEGAERELWTALELSDGNGPARQNLLTNYFLMGERDSLASFIRSQKIPENEVQQAQTLAASIRGGSL
ncbi:MAG: hypothetical protein LAT61_02190 [Alcanivorax sp.]|nr:hypothetical protein [Alcanivorax sp.]